MAFIPVADCVQVRPQFQSVNGVVAENVFYCGTGGVPSSTDLTDIAAVFHTWLLDALMPVMSNQWSVVSLALRAMNEEEGIGLVTTTGYPIVGGATDLAAPFNVAYTITWSTGLIGRSARGRSYGFGLQASSVVGGNRLSDAAHTALQAKWDALRSGLETAGHALQVVSFQEDHAIRTAGRSLPVIGTNVRFPIATQRRRLS